MTHANDQNSRYAEAADAYGDAMQRLARAVEADADKRNDLLQDIHLALWRSLAAYDNRCSLRTWVYRVAHNIVASHVDRERRHRHRAVTLDDFDQASDDLDPAIALDDADRLARLHRLIRALKTPDRQVLTLYLEDLEASAIAEITGLSPGAVATRISRIKARLAKANKETPNA